MSKLADIIRDENMHNQHTHTKTLYLADCQIVKTISFLFSFLIPFHFAKLELTVLISVMNLHELYALISNLLFFFFIFNTTLSSINQK